MKKNLFLLLGLLMSFNVMAHPINQGENSLIL